MPRGLDPAFHDFPRSTKAEGDVLAAAGHHIPGVADTGNKSAIAAMGHARVSVHPLGVPLGGPGQAGVQLEGWSIAADPLLIMQKQEFLLKVDWDQFTGRAVQWTWSPLE